MKRYGKTPLNVVVYSHKNTIYSAADGILAERIDYMGVFRLPSRSSDNGRLIYLDPCEVCVGDGIRNGFDEDKLDELARSIRRNGLIQPISVAKTKDGYKLIFGERRLRASIIAKMKQIPCIVMNEAVERPKLYSLLENLQREDLTFFEQAEGINALIMQYGMSRQEISERLGLSESAISNKLRLLRLSPLQRESIENMSLTERHARTLLRICDDGMRTRALREMIERRMNVEEAERYVDRLLLPKTPTRRNKLVVKDIRLFVNSINKAINVMKISGINAQSRREEDDDYIKYTVLISKKPNDLSDNEAI